MLPTILSGQKTAGQIREWADYITAKFDKDILIMETGYSWDKTLPDNTRGSWRTMGRILISLRSTEELHA